MRQLAKYPDDNITVRIGEKEYVIDTISHIPNYTDSPATHLCLNCRDGGSGEIKR